MYRKIITIFLMALLITTALPALGYIKEDNKINRTFIDYNYLEQQINGEGYALTDWFVYTRLLASDGEDHDFFGVSVAIDGDYALIGAYGYDNSRGSAYVFKRDGAIWTEGDKLTASDGQADDYFGWSVSIDGDYALIGAQNDDNYKGSAYVFKRDGSTWIQEDKLTASDGQADDLFGRSVSIDGEYALIGAYGDESYKGSAYVFKRDGAIWTEEYKLTASDGQAGDLFGWSVCTNTDFAIIGTYGANLDKGSAYVFKRDGSTWTQEDKLIASDGESGDGFGFSVSIHGNYAFIGEPWDDGDLGSAFVFKRDGTTWTEEEKLTATDGETHDWFGWSVSIDNDYALIGAYGDNSERGSVYVFEKDDDIWNQKDKLNAEYNESGDSFGWSVSIDGNRALIGVPRDDNEKGSGYIFEKNQPPSKPKINGETDGNVGTKYDYKFINCTDPNYDNITFHVEWGDDGVYEGFVPSNGSFILNHSWSEKGRYTIKAKLVDEHGAEGEWSYFSVTMPFFYNNPFWWLNGLLDNFPLVQRLLEVLIR